MAVLNKPWSTADRISPDTAVVTGEGEEGAEAPEPKIADQATLIYVTDGAETIGFDKIEKVVLMDDSVCVGMHAFKCVKMTPDAIAGDPLLADEGKEVPRFILVSRDCKKVDVIEGSKLSAKGLFKAMEKHAKYAYKTKFKKNIKDAIKVLGEFDKIANERKMLQMKEERNDKPSKADEKKMAKEKEELAQREKEAIELKAKLLTFEPKKLKA